MEEVLAHTVNYREAIRRRLPIGVAVAGGLLIIALGLALGLPAVYESRAVILIEQQDIPEDLVRSLNTGYADQRIQVIAQRVLTSANLREIIERFELYPDEREKDPMELVIGRMREDISVEPVSVDIVDQRSGKATQATIAVELSFQNPDALTAQRVANDLVSLFLSENLKQRTEAAEDTLAFLTAEATRLDGTVKQIEGDLARFKEKHVDALPELSSLNLQLLTRAEQDLTQVENQIRSLEQQRVYLESELAQQEPKTKVLTMENGQRLLGPADRLKALESEFITLRARYGASHPDEITMKREIESLRQQTGNGAPASELAARLQNLQAELSASRERYGEEHPTIVRLKREVSALKDQVEVAKTLAEAPSDRQEDAAPDNPVYVQLGARLDATRSDIGSLKGQAAGLRQKIADLESRLTAAPQVEREYSALMRDYEIAVTEYREVQAKRQQALLAQNLEEGQKGERFTLIEPPIVPEEPASPNRFAIAFLGLLLATAGGVGAGAVAEAMDDRIYGRTGVLNLTGISPLAIIPVIDGRNRTGFGSRRSLLIGLVLLVMVVGVLIAIHFLVRPLDVIFYSAMRSFG